MILMGDVKAELGNDRVAELEGKWGVSERNENGEWLVDVCT